MLRTILYNRYLPRTRGKLPKKKKKKKKKNKNKKQNISSMEVWCDLTGLGAAGGARPFVGVVRAGRRSILSNHYLPCTRVDQKKKKKTNPNPNPNPPSNAGAGSDVLFFFFFFFLNF